MRTEQTKSEESLREAFDLFVTPAMLTLLMDSASAKMDDTVERLPEHSLRLHEAKPAPNRHG